MQSRKDKSDRRTGVIASVRCPNPNTVHRMDPVLDTRLYPTRFWVSARPDPKYLPPTFGFSPGRVLERIVP